MRVLIGDDDPLMRNVIRSVAKAAGHEVVAETENPDTATELIARYAPDIVVVDLPRPGGGEAVLRYAASMPTPCRVVVFSTSVADADALLAAGAAAVVEKPQFDQLESTLAIWATRGRERRRAPILRDAAHAVVRSPSGLEEGRDFYSAVAASVPGDAVLVLQLEDHAALADGWGDVIASDWVLHLARLARVAIRNEDRLASFDGKRVHAFLSQCGAEGVQTVVDRVVVAWRRDLGPAAPRFRPSWTVQDGTLTPTAFLTQADAAPDAG
jgi:CheY-like chemotaxis protein